MKQEIFTQSFKNTLGSLGYSVPDIISDLSYLKESSNAQRLLKKWTGLPNNTIKDGLFNRERDIVAPKIYLAIEKKFDQWMKSETIEELPTLTVKEVSRTASISPQQVVSVLARFPFVFDIAGYTYTSSVQKPIFPDDRLSLKDSKRFGVSASRVSREGRYQSKKPGGNQVQKAGLQNSRINNVIRTRSWENLKIRFSPTMPKGVDVDYGVMEDLEIQQQIDAISAADIMYAEPNAQNIVDVYNWFQKNGYGNNWIYKQKEALFAEKLVRLSRGESVDFLIWNCIGFKWFTDPKGGMPTCNIENNLDAAITPFFQNRIDDLYTFLSTLGNPNIIILVPSNEGLDTSGVWKYKQPEDERRYILNQTVSGLQEVFTSGSNANIQVMLWQDYIASRGANETTESYSRQGANRIRGSQKFSRILNEAVLSGKKYFAQNGITNINEETLRERELLYYGVYAGEGVVYEELQNRGQNIVVVNFEEFRVPQMEFLGANGDLAIATPITEEEMLSYYQWEARQVTKRTI